MSNITITNDQLMDIILTAFKDGEQWGVTYSTWFLPTEKATNEQISETTKKARVILMGESK